MNLSLFLLTTFVLRINLLHIIFVYSSVFLSRSCCAFRALENSNINGDIFINDWLDFDVHSVVGCWRAPILISMYKNRLNINHFNSARAFFNVTWTSWWASLTMWCAVFFRTINLTERVEQMNVWVFEHSNNAEHRAFVYLNHCWASIQYQWANWTHKGTHLMPPSTYVIWLLRTCNTRSWCFDYK